MDINSEGYFTQALHEAKIQELVESYKQRGFVVSRKLQDEHQEFDLILRSRKSNKILAFEVLVSSATKEPPDRVKRLRRTAEQLGYEFRLVTINRPAKYSIEIDWFDTELHRYLVNEPLSELDHLASHVYYEDVESEIHSIDVTGTLATVKSTGTIELKLQYGSDSDIDNDMGAEVYDSAAYEGAFELDLAAKVILDADIIVHDSEL